jgi:hypothetical protein
MGKIVSILVASDPDPTKMVRIRNTGLKVHAIILPMKLSYLILSYLFTATQNKWPTDFLQIYIFTLHMTTV